MSIENLLLFGLTLSACCALFNFSKQDVVENFINAPRTIKVVKEQVQGGQTSSLPATANFARNTYSGPMNTQSQMRGRVQAQVKLADDIIEPFVSDGGCNQLSAAQMQSSVNQFGETVNPPIVYDRLIYANKRSKNYAQGDPIRGDLPIMPDQGQWFRPSANPNIDLRDGAMFSVFGDTQSTQQMLALKSASVNGLVSPGGGGNTVVTQNPYASQGTVQKSMSLSSTGGVHVTAFP